MSERKVVKGLSDGVSDDNVLSQIEGTEVYVIRDIRRVKHMPCYIIEYKERR